MVPIIECGTSEQLFLEPIRHAPLEEIHLLQKGSRDMYEIVTLIEVDNVQAVWQGRLAYPILPYFLHTTSRCH